MGTRANKFSWIIRKFSKVKNIEVFNWVNKKQTLLETFFRFFDSVCRASIGICVCDKSVEICWPRYRGKTDFEIFCLNSKEILIKYFKILQVTSLVQIFNAEIALIILLCISKIINKANFALRACKNFSYKFLLWSNISIRNDYPIFKTWFAFVDQID